jgi:hypothetical protein
MKLLKILFALIILLSVTSCDPQKRINRILKKHPELITKDTIIVRDTVTIDGTSTDTIFKTQVTKDTVILKEKQLTIKYYNDGKTTYLAGKCDTVKVPVEIKVPVETIKNVTEYKTHWYDYLARGVFAGLLIVLLLIIILTHLK